MNTFKVLAATAAFSLAWASSAAAATAIDLVGAWKAAYRSDDSADANLFDVVFEAAGPRAIIGRATELNLIAPETGTVFLVSDLQGSVAEGGEVRFTKTYVNNRGVSHSVSYVGRLQDGGRRITGTYSVGGMSGMFELAR